MPKPVEQVQRQPPSDVVQVVQNEHVGEFCAFAECVCVALQELYPDFSISAISTLSALGDRITLTVTISTVDGTPIESKIRSDLVESVNKAVKELAPAVFINRVNRFDSRTFDHTFKIEPNGNSMKSTYTFDLPQKSPGEKLIK